MGPVTYDDFWRPGDPARVVCKVPECFRWRGHRLDMKLTQTRVWRRLIRELIIHDEHNYAVRA